MEETPQTVAENLCNTFIDNSPMTKRDALVWALFTANQMLSATPMYISFITGLTNPKWRFYKQVVNNICDKIKSCPSQWTTLDWNDRDTWPEEMRKVWVVSDKIPYDAECICQRDGGFYPIDREYPLDEAEEAGLKWCYLIKPEKN